VAQNWLLLIGISAQQNRVVGAMQLYRFQLFFIFYFLIKQLWFDTGLVPSCLFFTILSLVGTVPVGI
jgi:hypothetical protein